MKTIFVVLLGVVALTHATPIFPGYYQVVRPGPIQRIPGIFGQSSWMNQMQPFSRSFGLSSLTDQDSIFPSMFPIGGRRPFMSTIIPLSNRITPPFSSHVPRSFIGSTFPFTTSSWTGPLSPGISRYTTSSAPLISTVATGIPRYTSSFIRNISPLSPVSSLTSVGQISPSSFRILPIDVTTPRDVATSVGPLPSFSGLNAATGSATRISPLIPSSDLSASQSGIASITSSASSIGSTGAVLEPIGVIDGRGIYQPFAGSMSGLQTLSSASPLLNSNTRFGTAAGLGTPSVGLAGTQRPVVSLSGIEANRGLRIGSNDLGLGLSGIESGSLTTDSVVAVSPGGSVASVSPGPVAGGAVRQLELGSATAPEIELTGMRSASVDGLNSLNTMSGDRGIPWSDTRRDIILRTGTAPVSPLVSTPVSLQQGGGSTSWINPSGPGSLNAQGVDARSLSTSTVLGQGDGGFPWIDPRVSGSLNAMGGDVRLTSRGVSAGSLNTGSLNSGTLNAGSLHSGGFTDGILNSQRDVSGRLNAGRIVDTGLRNGGLVGSFTGGQVADGVNAGGVYPGGLNSVGVADGGLNSQGFASQSLNSRGFADLGNPNVGGVATGSLNSRSIIDVERQTSGGFASRGLNPGGVAFDNLSMRRVGDVGRLNSREGVLAGGLISERQVAGSRDSGGFVADSRNTRFVAGNTDTGRVGAGTLSSRDLAIETSGGVAGGSFDSGRINVANLNSGSPGRMDVSSGGAYDVTGMNSLTGPSVRGISIQDSAFTGSTNAGISGGDRRDVAFIDTGVASTSGHAGVTAVINHADPGFIRSSQGLDAGSITRLGAGSITRMDPAGPANPGNLQGADPTYVTDVNSIVPGSRGAGTDAVGGSLSVGEQAGQGFMDQGLLAGQAGQRFVDQGLVAGQAGQGFVDQGLVAEQAGQGFVDQGLVARQGRTGGVSVDVRVGGASLAAGLGPSAGIDPGLSLNYGGAAGISRNSGPLSQDLGAGFKTGRPNIINDRPPGRSVL